VANHANYRRRIIRDARFRTSRSYNKGAGDSRAYEKREWNQHVRRDARRFCRDFYRLNHILFSGYPEWESVRAPVVPIKKPYMD
jgi:hypothetical protein